MSGHECRHEALGPDQDRDRLIIPVLLWRKLLDIIPASVGHDKSATRPLGPGSTSIREVESFSISDARSPRYHRSTTLAQPPPYTLTSNNSMPLDLRRQHRA